MKQCRRCLGEVDDVTSPNVREIKPRSQKVSALGAETSETIEVGVAALEHVVCPTWASRPDSTGRSRRAQSV